MKELLASLKELGAQIYLYKGNHEVNMDFLSNTIESYKGITEDREKNRWTYVFWWGLVNS